MTVYIEAPSTQTAPGGLLSVAHVVDSNANPTEGLTYLSEACGTAAVVPGSLCGMATVTLSQTGLNLTVSISDAPAGLYTFTYDGPGAPVVQTALGPNPTTTFTVTNGAAQVVDITSNVGIATAFSGLTLPLATPVVLEVGEKLFQKISVVTGDPFTIYKGVECLYVGDDDTEWARRALAVGEGRAVEEGVLRQILTRASTVNLTPGSGAVKIRRGVSLLEGYAAQVYGGVPTIHASRTVASLALTDRAFQSDDAFRVTTRQGAVVANGGGYEANLGPNQVVPAAGEAWLYITGTVTLVRSEVDAYRALDWKRNNQQALAERIYTPLVECFVAAVRVTLENS